MISNVYAYYISQYGSRPYSKYNTHKKEELRDVYNNIVRLNRASPFYSVDISEESQKFAIDIKESARSLAETAYEITDALNGDMTFKSAAVSDDPETISVEYIGDKVSADESHSFTMEVKQLATPQVNTGNFLSQTAKGLSPGTYSFDVNISSITYDLRFAVGPDENNRAIQDKLTRLVNKAEIGLRARVITNEANRSALELTSNMTGIHGKPAIFTVSDKNATESSGAVDLFGLDRTSHYPSNAIFNLNGEERSSTSNIFTVDRRFELTLKKTHEPGSVATIGLKQNLDAIVDSLHKLSNCYNSIYKLAKSGTTIGSKHLSADLSQIAQTHRDALSSNGLSINSEGFMEIDDEKLHKTSNEDLMNNLSEISKFKNALQKKAKDVMINPMEYISKSIISYKHPTRPSGDTYSTSIYTGMLYNGYC